MFTVIGLSNFVMHCRKVLISWQGGTDVGSNKAYVRFLGELFTVSIFGEITWFFEWQQANEHNSVALPLRHILFRENSIVRPLKTHFFLFLVRFVWVITLGRKVEISFRFLRWIGCD